MFQFRLWGRIRHILGYLAKNETRAREMLARLIG